MKTFPFLTLLWFYAHYPPCSSAGPGQEAPYLTKQRGELCCMVKLSRGGGGGGGGRLHCVLTSHCHWREKGETLLSPVFLQIKLISSRALLKEELLRSGTSCSVRSHHKKLCYSRGAQLLCCCCQSRGPSPWSPTSTALMMPSRQRGWRAGGTGWKVPLDGTNSSALWWLHSTRLVWNTLNPQRFVVAWLLKDCYSQWLINWGGNQQMRMLETLSRYEVKGTDYNNQSTAGTGVLGPTSICEGGKTLLTSL